MVELEEISLSHSDIGASLVVSAMELWLFTLEFLKNNRDSKGKKLYTGFRQGVTFPMADALSWLLASRSQILDVLELEEKGSENPALRDGLPGMVGFFSDLSIIQAVRAAGEVSRTMTELFRGYSPDVSEAEEDFMRLRRKVDKALSGSCFARERAGVSLSSVMIPEVLDYPG